MSKLEDKLIASVNKKEQEKPAASNAPAERPAEKTAPAKKPVAKTKKKRQKMAAATGARQSANPAPSQGELHPKRIWPD